MVSNDRIQHIKVVLFYFLKNVFGFGQFGDHSCKYAEHINVICPVLLIAEEKKRRVSTNTTYKWTLAIFS